ncbi:MAG: hypothetical protein ACTHU0_09115 [Kofleriaceae bacterium]
MKAVHFVSIVSSVVALGAPVLAHAEDEATGFDRAVAPVQSAFEIAIGGGYTQGGGDIGQGMATFDDLAGAGGGGEIQLGYRIIPNLTVGLYGTFSTYAKGDAVAEDTSVFGASAGVQAAWHFRPASSIDPWVSLGTGWRGLWMSPDSGKTSALQGLELARLQVGADYRITPNIAISPVVGASVSMFLASDSPMTEDYDEINDKKVNFQGFAGLVGRFDLGGRR